ncbi:MAG: bifunctional folylpolyglutamate synthase/dihydrofolate synthase, partial [Mogibacterium sp.]|nr:bifunctional folylpolyglutamate synthase/dihydrofolate synthase [Mogibacterium sp.]
MAVSDGLDRMKTLLDALGHPEADFRVIHIAGTNGKGSTAVMTASILEEAGYKVGLYTSPHLESECERIQIWDGEHHLIDQAHFDELKDRARSACEGLTVFEVYTAAA